MTRYDSFLLRVWRRSGTGAGAWAARLEHVQDGCSVRFNTPEALVAYLQATVVPSPGADGHDRQENAP